jgi:hypothetical protein
MAKETKVKEEEVVETEVEETKVKTKPDSEAKAEYRKIIEAYAKSNPVKYELKKTALLAKLNTL